jgi:hypothetical protein
LIRLAPFWREEGVDGLNVMAGVEGTVIGLSFSRLSVSGSDRSSCTLRIPITIPAGYSAVVSGGEGNGYTYLEAGDVLSVASRLFLLGATSGVQSQRIIGPAYVDFGPVAADPYGSGSVFDSPHRISTGCMTRDSSGLLGLNLAASLSSATRSGFATITDAAIGVQLVPCH